MARSRNIKPGFFMNDELAEIEPVGRLLFAGLWCIADREGRLEDRPKRIKAEVLPYDDCDVDQLLNKLAKHDFIIRYEVDGEKYIQVTNFAKHQNPHYKEIPSEIPAPPDYEDSAYKYPAPTEKERQAIFERDGYQCICCGSTENLSLDHIVPRSHGGTSNPDNLQTLCKSCNSKKGNKLAAGMVGKESNVGSSLTQRRADDESSSAQVGTLIPDSLNMIPDSLNLDPDWRGSGGTNENDSEPQAELTESPNNQPEELKNTTPEEKEILAVLKSVELYPFGFAKDLQFIRDLSTDYPTLDMVYQTKKWRDYKRDKPLKKNSSPRAQLRNWMNKAEEWRNENNGKDGKHTTGGLARADPAGKYREFVRGS